MRSVLLLSARRAIPLTSSSIERLANTNWLNRRLAGSPSSMIFTRAGQWNCLVLGHRCLRDALGVCLCERISTSALCQPPSSNGSTHRAVRICVERAAVLCLRSALSVAAHWFSGQRRSPPWSDRSIQPKAACPAAKWTKPSATDRKYGLDCCFSGCDSDAISPIRYHGHDRL